MVSTVLNLYAGIGGNRKLWTNVKVTAIENDKRIAEVYKDLYPEDEVIIADAHAYLLDHYKEFDFIWSSPPCPTHGQYRYRVGVLAKGYKAVYPDMTLYEEIIFLKHYVKSPWVVENTISYYKPLIEPQKINRHYFWSNYNIPPYKEAPTNLRVKNKISDFKEWDLSKYKLTNKRQVLRNCVSPELGLHIYNSLLKEKIMKVIDETKSKYKLQPILL